MHRLLSPIRWVLVGFILITLLGPAAYSFATGQKFVTVDGRSMTPTYQLGDLILVGTATRADFAPGHVITVRAKDGSLYTHRIVSITDDKAQLKGDGNAIPDPQLVPYSHVVGAVLGHVSRPAATVIDAILQWPTRLFLAILTVGLIFLPISQNRLPREQASTAESLSVPPDHDDDVEFWARHE